MLFFVMVYIKIFFLQSCVANSVDTACLQDYNYNKVILLQTNMNDEKTLELNRHLKNACKHRFKFEMDKKSYSSRIGGMIEASVEYRNVINLNVDNYYTTELSHTIKSGLAYAGDLSIMGPTLYYASNKTRKASITYHNVKMVSERVTEIDGGLLYNFITSMDYDSSGPYPRRSYSGVINNSESDTIFVCLKNNIPNFELKLSEQFCPLRFIIGSNCLKKIDTYKDTLLAVLTSKPFHIDYDLPFNTPTIFYGTPFMFMEEQATFPNSIVSQWTLLKYPILKFLQQMNWRRVTIITDDSPASVAFEEDLTKLFGEHLITYSVKRCEEPRNCDIFFKNVRETLKEERARIIIANFDEKYLSQLNIPDARWILREWSPKWTKRINHGYLVTLAPEGRDSAKYEQLELNLINEEHTRIVEYIKHISEAYHKMASLKDINNIERTEFYRQLTREIKKSMASMAYVSRVIDKTSTKISYMKVTEHGVREVLFQQPHDKYMDVVACIFRSNNYNNPCNDIEFILIMFVVIVFSVSLLIVIVYFHKTSLVFAPRYNQF